MSARQIRVRGLVQGVGFRPYVWRLANELGLNGWVWAVCLLAGAWVGTQVIKRIP